MISTRVRYIGGKDLWEGQLPVIPRGYRMDVKGQSMRVMDSSITLMGRCESDPEYRVIQLIVVELNRD
jgi:hypothetical protein